MATKATKSSFKGTKLYRGIPKDTMGSHFATVWLWNSVCFSRMEEKVIKMFIYGFVLPLSLNTANFNQIWWTYYECHIPTTTPFGILMKAFVGQPFLIQIFTKNLCVYWQKSVTSSSKSFQGFTSKWLVISIHLLLYSLYEWLEKNNNLIKLTLEITISFI